MATHYVNPGTVTVNGVDLTDCAYSCVIETTADELDATTFQAPYKITKKGVPDASVTIGFYQDYAAAKVDATLNSLVTSTTPFAMSVKVAAGAISATNPEYQLAAAMLFTYNPVNGSMGEMSSTEVTFKNAGTGGLVRDITP
jgi:hypothetical protein